MTAERLLKNESHSFVERRADSSSTRVIWLDLIELDLDFFRSGRRCSAFSLISLENRPNWLSRPKSHLQLVSSSLLTLRREPTVSLYITQTEIDTIYR